MKRKETRHQKEKRVRQKKLHKNFAKNYPKKITAFVIALVAISSIAYAWYGTNSFRYPIVEKTTDQLSISVNGTNKVGNQDIFWANLQNDSYVYCAISGCQTGGITIANNSYIKNFENETVRLGNSPTNVWNGYNAVWHFGENAGTTIHDSTSNSYSITDDNSAWATGLFGQAYSSAGSANNAKETTGNSIKSLISGTVETWVYPTAQGPYDNYVATDGAGLRMGFNVPTANSFGCTLNNGVAWLDTNAPVNYNSWYFFSCSWDGSYLYYHIANSTFYKAGRVSNVLGTGLSSYFQIAGNGGDSNNEFNGRIDEVRISPTNRSESYFLNTWSNGIGNLTSTGSEETLPTAPYVLIDKPTNSTYTTNPIPFNFSAYDFQDTLFQFSAWLNDVLFFSNAAYPNDTWISNISTLTNGYYNFTIKASNSQALSNESSQFFTVATTTTTTTTTTSSSSTTTTTTGAGSGSCSIIDTSAPTYCFSNDTEARNYTLNGAQCFETRFCAYGCDSVTQGCNTNPFYAVAGFIGFLVIIFMVAIYFVTRRRR